MKLKEGYITHEIDGKYVLVSSSPDDFSGLVRSNETAVFIIEQLKHNVSRQDIIDSMLKEYDAPKELIESDVDKVINTLNSIGAIDD